MICEKNGCGGEIRVTHTYRAGKSSKTSSGVCGACGQRYTLATIVVCEASGYGRGAAALAERLRKNGNGALSAEA